MCRRFFCKVMLTVAIFWGLLVLPAGLALAANENASGLERIPVLIGFHQVPGAAEQALVRSHGGQIK